MNTRFWLLVLALSFQSVSVFAQAPSGPVQHEEVLVTAKAEKTGVDFKPDVEGAKIYAGKKTSEIRLDEFPPIVNNNYRQALQKTPGLLISEETTPLFSMGYRGLNPDRAQYMQVLKDGIPIVADLFGYPEAYYTPPLELVDHIDFIRGGSALLYGPQPGGAINYVTKDPYEGPFGFETENAFGSHDFYSNYTSLSGTHGPWGHYSYLHHRQSQGFRDFNSQYDVWYGGSKVVIAEDDTAKWTLAFDLYNEEHGEPGGLTRVDFDTNASRTTRMTDHFELNRYYGSVTYNKEVSENTLYDFKLFGGYYERLSWRQRGGGFGTIPTGAAASANDIQNQEFYTGGADFRLKHDYSTWWNTPSTLTAGAFYYHSISPRVEELGGTGDALSGVVQKDSDRTMNYVALFVENLFRFGPLSVVPSARLENIWQSIDENVNVAKTTVPLADESDYDLVPLFGVGADIDVTESVELYGNLSQSYRPKVYADAVPLGTNQVVSGDLDEGEGWQAEAGLRGHWLPAVSWDASVFHMEFDDQTGTVGNTIQNVGDAEYDGVELAVEVDLEGWVRQPVSVFYNVTYLDGEFVKGPTTGNTPQFAPQYLMRGGIEYNWQDRIKVILGGTFVDEHFGDDANLAQRIIPGYQVWDLTAEAKVYNDMVSVFGGINNLFDKHYFARVTGSGIDPADGTNYYGGVKFKW